MLKRVKSQEPIVQEIEFQFEFDIDGVVHRIITKGVDEKHSLSRLKKHLDYIFMDIVDELEVKLGEEQKKKITTKKVVELKEPPVTVSNGIVFNQPKRVNDPGFQPKFREEIN